MTTPSNQLIKFSNQTKKKTEDQLQQLFEQIPTLPSTNRYDKVRENP